MAEEIREVAGAAEAAGVRPLLRLARRALPARAAQLHRPQLRLAPRPGLAARPAARAWCALGGLRQARRAWSAGYFADDRLQKLFTFQAMYAGLAPFEALAIYCVITYMDTVEGVYFPEGGMHAVARGLAAAAEKAGGDVPLRRRRSSASSAPRAPAAGCAACALEPTARWSTADAVVVQPRPARGLPDAAARAARPGCARKGHYSPSCALWLAGVAGDAARRTPPTTTSTSASEWDGAFDDLLERGTLMPDPSILVTVPASTSRPVAGRRDGLRHSLYVLEPVPNLDGKVDWTSERDRPAGRLARPGAASLGYPRPPTSRSSASSTPPTGSARAWSGARRSRWPTASSRPARSGPNNVDQARARPGLRRLRHACPASACPWCCCRAGWPPSGWTQLARSR